MARRRNDDPTATPKDSAAWMRDVARYLVRLHGEHVEAWEVEAMSDVELRELAERTPGCATAVQYLAEIAALAGGPQ